jgi:serine/threonine protein kinase
MTPIAGQTIGTFILRQKVAEGGMGSVWAAEHVTLHRDVAVKFLTRSPSADDDTVRRFELEARTMARISSPHVPQIFDQGVCPDGTLYIVMELVAGVDLRTWVAQRGGHLDLAQVVRLVDHICLAMSAAHELGIIHRDIKPENIILSGGDDDFHATLVDFGIAKSIGLHLNAPGLTLAGSTMGTPSYMSPEQLTNVSAVDERSDVWSLAVAAYWALTGCLPRDQPRPLRAGVRDVPWPACRGRHVVRQGPQPHRRATVAVGRAAERDAQGGGRQACRMDAPDGRRPRTGIS